MVDEEIISKIFASEENKKEWLRSNQFLKVYSDKHLSGKTFLASCNVWLISQRFPGTTILVARKNYGDLVKDTRSVFFSALKVIEKVIRKLDSNLDNCKKHKTPLINGSIINSFSPSSNVLRVNTFQQNKTSTIVFRKTEKGGITQLHGLNIGMLFLDELTEVEEAIFRSLMCRLRHSAQKNNYRVVTTGGEMNRNHWIYNILDFANKNKLGRLFHNGFARPLENDYLPDDYKGRLGTFKPNK
jgi:hypothetical protein